MGKVIYLMGKSSTGKDTIFKELVERSGKKLQKIIPYTTRPIRVEETDGTEYHFTDEAGFLRLEQEGRVIEYRCYHTCYGMWRYFTVDDGSIVLEDCNYIIIGTLDSYEKTKEYFGEQKVVPVLIELDDGIRLQRALDRERSQDNPGYEELCRRFLADSEDFSEERIAQTGIRRRFCNDDLERCLKEIQEYIGDNV